MSVRVLVPPQPIVTPSDVPGDYADGDATVKALIAAATASIDGPNGMLQRALGAQTLQLVVPRAPIGWSDRCEIRLPLPPLIAVESVTAIAENGSETQLDAIGYVVRGVGTDEGLVRLTDGWPDATDEIRIRYRAGYDGDVTPAVPDNAKAAVMLMAQDHIAGVSATGGERSFQVDGAFTENYNSPDQVQRTRSTTIKMLLASLRVFR